MIVVFPTSPPPTSTFTPDPGRHSKCSSVRYLSIVSFRIVGAAVIFSGSLNHCTEPELSTKANASTPRGIAPDLQRGASRDQPRFHPEKRLQQRPVLDDGGVPRFFGRVANLVGNQLAGASRDVP